MLNKQEKYQERLTRVETAIALKEPDRLPVVPWVDGLPYFLYPESNASHKTALYDVEKAMEAHIRYHLEFEPDCNTTNTTPLSGRAADFLHPTMMEWPGRVGSPLGDDSLYQMLEIEYLKVDEYDELLRDYTGFILHKYLPRSFAGLVGLEKLDIDPSSCIMDRALRPLAKPEVQEALKKLIQYGEERAAIDIAQNKYVETMQNLGYPPIFIDDGEVPFDVLSDYFRGTMGTLYDQIERPQKILAACDKFTQIQIDKFSHSISDVADVRRVFFPMHKGMDYFISDEQYRELYWAPYQKLLRYLVGIGVTPIIYTEGQYFTRCEFIREQLMEFPPGSCMIHFEFGDFAELKKIFSGVACIFGGVSLQLLEYGTKEEVRERVKYLAENCATGGGYILDASGTIDRAKRENIEAMFEAARSL